MAVEPIHARCRHCNAQLLLPHIIRDTGGRCPTCTEVLAPGYTHLLLEEARRAEVLQRSLILSLRRLQGLPGNLSLDVASVLRNALADIDRDEQLDDDRDIIRRHASEIIPRAKTWRSLPGPERRRRASGLVSSIRGLAQRLRRYADQVEHAGPAARRPHPEPATLRAAADRADASADAVADERRRCDDIVRDAMTAVDDSVAVTGSGQRAKR